MCGQWWSDYCADRFYNHPPYESAYAVIAGKEATLRVFVLFQEDGQRNSGYVSQSAFSRHAVVVNGTRRNIAFYQLNGEHGIGTAYSEFVDTVGVSVFGSKSEMTGAVLFVKDSKKFASYGHGGPARNTMVELTSAQCDNMDPCPWKPSLYRIVVSSKAICLCLMVRPSLTDCLWLQDSEDVRFVNLQGQGVSNTSMVFDLNGGEGFSTPRGEWPAIYFRSPK